MLLNCEAELTRFIDAVSHLGEKLGPLLLLLPHGFKLKHFNQLKDFLSILPENHRFVVEVRNKEMLIAAS